MKKILTCLLYGLPVVFFATCYFLMTVWGEDIIQGAGTVPDIWNDLVGAFQHNSRLSDMYAWTVINFFDFQYSFGVDTIFRLVDVAMATEIIYLLTALVLGRWPKWQLSDALIFALSFLLIFLTPHGYTLYRGFSVIHNYLIIGLTTLLFALPFLRGASGEKVPGTYKHWLAALAIGLIFGMSSNITPIAFLISFALVKLEQTYQVKSWRKVWRLPSWQIYMLSGMVVTLVIAYVFGAGVSSYANNPVYTGTYDYVALSEIWRNFGSALFRIVKHIAINFGYSFGLCGLIVIVMGSAAAIVSRLKGQKFHFWPKDQATGRKITLCVTFAAVYLLCGSQIMLPVRLALPAYLALVVAVVMLCKAWWLDAQLITVVVPAFLMITVVFIMVVIKAKFALDYRVEMGGVLTAIEKSEAETVCISPLIAKPKKLPFINLGQDETFAEWALPKMRVYGKEVQYCTE